MSETATPEPGPFETVARMAAEAALEVALAPLAAALAELTRLTERADDAAAGRLESINALAVRVQELEDRPAPAPDPGRLESINALAVRVQELEDRPAPVPGPELLDGIRRQVLADLKLSALEGNN